MSLISLNPKPSLRNMLRYSVAGLALLCIAGAASSFAIAQGIANDPANYAWQAGAISHAQKMRAFVDSDSGQQATPPVIPNFEINFDPSGFIATAQPSGPTLTSQNAFFANLGTNGRTCFTCHQPQNGWGVSAASVQARFYVSFGTDPIFRLFDGATCPSDNVSSIDAKLQSYTLLLSRGLIRIGLPMPAGAQFQITSVDDPYNCNTNPTTGLTSPTTGIVSIYRRPLPSTSLGFLSTIMWDGREPNLQSQAVDATLGHAQAAMAPSTAQQQQIVNFELGIFTAQLFDNKALFLNAAGATGGPNALAQLLPGFFIGINDPFLPGFTSKIFDLYQAWNSIGGSGDVATYRKSVARGEGLFNNTAINITDVAGLPSPTAGFCGTCHDTPDVGNHSVKAPLNIGIANAGAGSPPALNISGLPVFTLKCMAAGPLFGQTFVVTDPGRALISGACADIGKLKGPILRGLAGRAPYFHNGSAASLLDVVNFYVKRFNINFSDQDKSDLVAFLRTL